MSTHHSESHADSHPELNASTDALLPNPGVPEHTWRPTDVSPKAERRAERQITTLFALSAIMTVLFVVAYFNVKSGVDGSTILGMGASNVILGLTLGLALLFIGCGIIQWARKLMADVEITQERHPAASPAEDRIEIQEQLRAALEESGMGRRPLLRNSLIGAVALLGAPAVVMLRDLGPTPNQVVGTYPGAGLEHTVWKAGMRIVRDAIGTPIKLSDIEIGDFFNAAPEILFPADPHGPDAIHGAEHVIAKSKAAVVLLRMDENDIANDTTRNWAVDGVVAYSKICTHVGCPISLNERTTHHLLCPCHQSTFDLADSGKVVFGPAARHLPQLPMGVDSEGYLIALSDFAEPVGPSYWERDSKSPEEVQKKADI